MHLKHIAIALAVALSAPAFAGGGPQHSQRPQDAMTNPSQPDADRSAGVSQGVSAVREAQEALQKKGYDVGQIDGVMGPKTSAALREFQQAQGLTASGSLDQKTLSALDVQSAGSTGSRMAPDTKSDRMNSSGTSGGAPSSMDRGSTSSDSSQRIPDASTSNDRTSSSPDPMTKGASPRSGG
jgi:peptidoglycan hydrolase-like protein with peptidoglycan-binding domain